MSFKKYWEKFGDLLGGTILHPQYFVKKIERETIAIVRNQAGGVFLDMGCGRQWYRWQLEPLFKRYLALDNRRTARRYHSRYPVEIWSDAAKIPLAKGSVDVALMLMVLEHLPDPQAALQEAARVLKRGEVLVIGTVENYPGHDFPYNYYHFTVYGLREMLRQTGFGEIKMRSFGNFWETAVIYQNVYLMLFIKRLVSGRWSWVVGLLVLVLAAPVMVLGNVAALILGRRKQVLEFALGHVVLARRR